MTIDPSFVVTDAVLTGRCYDELLTRLDHHGEVIPFSSPENSSRGGAMTKADRA
jgi:hypothetical protein